MDIVEHLGNLQISEECYNDIVNIAEDIIKKAQKEAEEAYKNYKDNKNLKSAVKLDKALGIFNQVRKNKNREVLSAIEREATKRYFDLQKEGSNKNFDEVHDEVRQRIRDNRGKDWKAPNHPLDASGAY